MALITFAQFADRLGVSVSRVRQLAQAERITVSRLSPRVVLIEEAELKRVSVRTAGWKKGRKRK